MRIGIPGFLCLALALAGAAAACGSSNADVSAGSPDGGGGVAEGGTQPGASGGLPCDVDKVLATNCRSCHGASPQFGAPMPLVTYADLTAPAKGDPSKKTYELVAAKIDGTTDRMPPPPNAPLADDAKATLKNWVAAGAPSSTEACGTGPGPGPDTSGIACKPDLTIAPASAYEMPLESGDEYVCYGVELSRPTPTHITGFAPRIDNAKIVHHIVLFEADSAYPAVPQKCNSGGSLQWRMVMGWAPGGKGLEMPPEAGFPIKSDGTSTHYVVQMHYSNPQGLSGQKDTSGFDVCTSAPRKYEADVLAFGTQQIQIEPGQTLAKECSVTIPKPSSQFPIKLAGIHLFAAMPHMHQLGTDMTTTLTRAGAPPQDLGTVTAWSFDTQAWLKIGTAPGGVVTTEDDVITTKCTWKNTSGQRVTFGENTADEMCYSFTLYYPKVQSGLWSWAAPATVSQCK